MYRGTTASLVFNINSDIDLNTIDKLYITIKSKIGDKIREYDKRTVDIYPDEHKIILPLSQADTLFFKGSKYFDEGRELLIQIRIKDDEGEAYASNIMHTELNDILKDGEI